MNDQLLRKNFQNFQESLFSTDPSSDASALCPPFSIVKLGPQWLGAVVELENLCCKSPWSSTLLEKELDRTDSVSFGVTYKERLVGQTFNYVVLDELHILNISVHPDFRGLRLGKFILLSILQAGVKIHSKLATLEVRESNREAIGLYHSLGFSLSAVRKNYYQDNGEDALVLDRLILESEYGALEALKTGIVDSLSLRDRFEKS